MSDLEQLRDDLRKKNGSQEDAETYNQRETEQARRQGAVMNSGDGDADVMELRRILGDAGRRTRLHAALDRVLDWDDKRTRLHAALDKALARDQRRRTCVGDRSPDALPVRDDFWDDWQRGKI